jgi:hypothetical protein
MYIVTIHDLDPRGFLAFDLVDILSCLGPTIRDYEWIVSGLECTSQDAQALCDEVQKNSGSGLRMTTEELQAAAKRFGQTIEGVFTGTPAHGTKEEILIRAVDTSYFEVMTHSQERIVALHGCFKDVRRREHLVKTA